MEGSKIGVIKYILEEEDDSLKKIVSSSLTLGSERGNC